MNFLGMVAAFLSLVWLDWYLFVSLDNNLLGLAGIALTVLAFIAILVTVAQERE